MTCPFCRSGPVWYSHSRFKGLLRMLLFSPMRYCFACHRRWQRHTLVTHLMGFLLRPKVLLVAVSCLLAYALTSLLGSSFRPFGWVERKFQKYTERRFAPSAAAPAGPRPGVAYRNMSGKQRREFEQYLQTENLR